MSEINKNESALNLIVCMCVCVRVCECERDGRVHAFERLSALQPAAPTKTLIVEKHPM